MKTVELLSELEQLGVQLKADGEELICHAPKGVLSNTLRSLLTQQKVELLQLLREQHSPSSGPRIIPKPEERYLPFPLTDIQQAYWLGRNGAFELGNVGNHFYVELNCQHLDIERLNQAWQRIIDRHEMLRAVVTSDGQQQILASVPPYTITVHDLRDQPNQTLEDLRQRLSHQLFQPEQWPLFEFVACRLDEEQTRLLISLEILNLDVTSVTTVFRELWHLYQHPETELTPLEISFRDYVLANQTFQKTEAYQKCLHYWKQRVATLPPAPELPLKQQPSAVTQSQFQRHQAQLSPEIWQRLKTLASQKGLSPSGLLLSVYAKILQTWSKTSHFTLNITLFNRLPLHPKVHEIAGDFTSLVLLEINNTAIESFEVQTKRIQKQLWDDLDHAQVEGIQILRELSRSQGKSHQAALPVVFTSALNANQDGIFQWLNQFGEMVYSISQTPQVWLDYQAHEQNGSLIQIWDAVADLFPDGMLDQMLAAQNHLLHQLATDEASWQQTSFELIPPEQLAQREAVNATQAPVSPQLLHTLFQEQVKQRSQQVAVISANHTLTYEQLHLLANQVGHRLRELKACPNQLVAVVMEKGWEQIVAVLGILYGGAAYVPIDPNLPQERIWQLLEQGEASLILTQPWWNQTLTWPEGLTRLEITDEEFSDVATAPLEPLQSPEDLAYVIFTSGSTGVPKGVMIDHRGAVNTILDINQRFGVTQSDRILALSALNFDLSVYDIFGLLAVGGTLILPDAAHLKDPSHWLDLVTQHQITLWNSVPALMQMLVEYLAPDGLSPTLPLLRLVMLSGDWIPLNLPDKIRTLAQDLQMISLGGATEASIWSILYPIETVDTQWKSIPYGQPMLNQTFQVLHSNLTPCPVWVPGHLYIGGIGLAKGYWKDAVKTQKSFIIHPETGERLYKTGDLGRYLPDGNIEFLGREDFQVKISGYRIELGEIETALEQHPAVAHAIVTAVGESRHQQQLVAYIVAQNQADLLAPSGQISDRFEQLEFKLKQPGLRRLEPQQSSIQLERPQLDEDLRQTYQQRRSYRQFLTSPISFTEFSQWLSCLLSLQLEGMPLAKYRYPSAGSLYPVQTYLYVKPGRIENLAAGLYYYHSSEHRLVCIAPEAKLDRYIHGEINQSIFDESAFSLFLVGKMSAITPLYGEFAKDFCLLEAGYMSQLLMSVAPTHQIGLCPIGNLNWQGIQDLFDLENEQIFLHSFLGGAIDPLGEKTSSKVATSADNLEQELRHFLQNKLPDYMQPVLYLPLETLPLSSNGKVDRQSLPKPTNVQLQPAVVYIPPQTDIERTLAEIVQHLLAIESVGINSNFFELGATSLHLIQIHGRIKEVLAIDVPIVEMFKHPTISFLAKHLSRSTDEKASTSVLERTTKQREMMRRHQQQNERKRNG